jgi:hypothetical protein
MKSTPKFLIAALAMTGLAVLTAIVLQQKACASSPPTESGIYFATATQHLAPVPTFAASKDQLPSPILDDRPDLIALYWEAWKIGFSHFRSPQPGSSLVSNYMDAAFSSHIFQWDTIFMIPFASYAHHIFPVIGSLDNFYAHQHSDGKIAREIVAATGEDYVYQSDDDTVNPPLFAWVEVVNAHLTGDTSRYNRVYLALTKYADYLETARHSTNTVHKLYWNTGLGSGMDNTPRQGSGWVDMSTQMVLMYDSLSEIAETLGKSADAQKFKAQARDISQRIQKYMWDDHDGLYYDVDDNGRFIKHKTIACFWPMLAKISDAKQAAHMMKNLEDPHTFWRKDPWPSLAANEPEYDSDGHYWVGGVWAPTNAMVVGGLSNYPDVSGTRELADFGAKNYVEIINQVYNNTHTIWEFYSPDKAEQGKLWWFIDGRKDFVGWSGIGPIQFLIENILGFHIDALQNKVTWRIQNLAHHGITGLHVGSSVISLEAAARSSANDPLTISADTEIPSGASTQSVDLEVTWNGTHYQRTLISGKQTISIP